MTDYIFKDQLIANFLISMSGIMIGIKSLNK